jgi:hypothetical protein
MTHTPKQCHLFAKRWTILLFRPGRNSKIKFQEPRSKNQIKKTKEEKNKNYPVLHDEMKVIKIESLLDFLPGESPVNKKVH